MDHPVVELGRVLFAVELVGVVAFAIAGALRAIEREMDVFGILVLAVITALGGGIIRDILVGRFPVSLAQPVYFYAAVGGGLVALPAIRVIRKYPQWLKLFDALGLALFSILGAQVGVAEQLNVLSIVLLGLLTGIGGGVLRDVLANDIPLVLRQEVYALASLVGILVFWGAYRLGVLLSIAVVLGAAVILIIRLAAIHWNLNLPRIYPR